ncbi:MAG: GNAT family N-acetyltransferase [Crocinitomicaceae bacterium]|nr:GNAT family N-acetyltransferase [Crocinitomicaceae bacterium]
MIIRPIQEDDNEAIARVIRDVLTEHGVNKPGTVFTDPTTDQLFELFQTENSAYFIVEEAGEVLGGCGIYPTEGLSDGCIELVKLYIHKKARGKGLGRKLMQVSINEAKKLNFKSVYLETLAELSNAVELYQELGFKKLDNAMGNSGHFACQLWMLKEL